MPAWIVASSSDAAYWPSRYSSTYEGTIALPLTALKRSFRTTAPAKCSLILSSRVDLVGAVSVVSASARTSIPPSASSRFVMALLEVEIRRERPLDGVVPLREQLPSSRVRDGLFEAQLDGPVVVLVSVPGQIQHRLLVPVALVVRCTVKCEDGLVRNQRVANVKAEAHLARSDLVSYRFTLKQFDCELPGGDLVSLGHEVDIDVPDVALPLLIDRYHRHHDLLKRCAAMDVAGASTRLRDTVDRLRNLNIDISHKPRLCRGERHEGRGGFQRPPKHVTSVGLGDRVPLRTL